MKLADLQQLVGQPVVGQASQPAPAPVAPPKPVNKKALFEKYPGIWTTLENEEIEAGYMALYGVGPAERTVFHDQWKPVPRALGKPAPGWEEETERQADAMWNLIKHRFEYDEGSAGVGKRKIDAVITIEFGSCVDGVYTLGRFTVHPDGRVLKGECPVLSQDDGLKILRGEKIKYGVQPGGWRLASWFRLINQSE